MVIALIVAFAMILQAVFGESVALIPGRVEMAAVLGQQYSAMRILPPGQTLIYVMFILIFCIIIYLNKPLLSTKAFYLMIIMGGAVALTYYRIYWVTILLLICIVLLTTSDKAKKRATLICIIALVSLGLITLIFLSIGGKPRVYILSVTARFTSVFKVKDVYQGSSIGMRRVEYSYALPQVLRNPIIGIGLSNHYRPRVFSLRHDTLTNYIHNAYLYIMLHMGLLGLIPFLWFYMLFVIRGFRNWRKVEDPFLRASSLGITLSGLGLAIVSILEPKFMELFSIVVIAVIMGINESIIKLPPRSLEY
jgi:O-antigen ligase